MSQVLTREQKVNFLMIFLDFQNSKPAHTDVFLHVNRLLNDAEIPFFVNKNKSDVMKTDVIQEQLARYIYNHVPANQLDELLSDAYDRIQANKSLNNSDYKSDVSATKSYTMDVNDGIQNDDHSPGKSLSTRQTNIVYRLVDLNKYYAEIEMNQSKQEALKSTLLFSLFLVTIPFSILYYNKKLKERCEQHYYRRLIVDNSYSDCLAKLEIESVKKSIHKKRCGMICKSVRVTDSDLPFKSALFSSKSRRVRKYIDSTLSTGENSYSIFCGSRDQIAKANDKYHEAYAKMNSEDEYLIYKR